MLMAAAIKFGEKLIWLKLLSWQPAFKKLSRGN
jgi:hypothetical protein